MTGFRLLSEIRKIEVIAVGRAIRDLPKLKKAYGKGRWRKLKGRALVEVDAGKVIEAELRWYEAHGIRQDMKVKRLLSWPWHERSASFSAFVAGLTRLRWSRERSTGS